MELTNSYLKVNHIYLIHTHRCDSYSKSKTLAELAAWDLVNKSESPGSLELAVVNPGFVIGPTLSANVGTSLDVCTQILNPKMPMTPRMAFNVVDVRDVAEGIVRAMVSNIRLPFILALGSSMFNAVCHGEESFSKYLWIHGARIYRTP